MRKLSVLITTKNEETKIRRCLDSLNEIADEIIIVDDESSDKTVDIARDEYGAKTIINKSGGNFDKQGNLGIDAASCEWVLHLDADEVIPTETVQKIKETLANDNKYSAFTLIRNDFVFGHRLNYVGHLPITKLFKCGVRSRVPERWLESYKFT